VDSEVCAESVLFKQFETVAYRGTTFSKIDVDLKDSKGYELISFDELSVGLQALDPDAGKSLDNSYVTFLVGAKDFGQEPNGPEGVGIESSDKCYIGIAKDGNRPNIVTSFRKAYADSIDGVHVWIWTIHSQKQSTPPKHYYAAQIADSYLEICNNRQDFQEAAKALTSAKGFHPELTQVFGWKTFTKYTSWTFRAFDKASVAEMTLVGHEAVTPDIEAIAYYHDIDSDDRWIQVFSSDTSMRTIPKILPASDLNGLRPQGSGIWQGRIASPSDKTNDDALYRLFAIFGFSVSI
jgi:hypothetical protein